MEEMKPSYVITGLGEKISRVNIVGTVVDKFIGENQNFVSVVIDDESSSIKLRVFGDSMYVLEKVSVGNLVSVNGKVKNYNGENYIVAESVRILSDSNWENLHKLRVLENIATRKKIAAELKNLRNDVTEEELEEYAKEKYGLDREILRVILESSKTEIDYKSKILEVIEKLDGGDGVEVGKLLEILNIPENVVESAITELLSSGTVYEPTVGKLKKV